MKPIRISRKEAMMILGIRDPRAFKRLTDRVPEIVMRLPGERKAKYRVDVIERLIGKELTWKD